MTETEQRVAIAEACGWKLFDAGVDSFGVYCEAHATKGHVGVLQSKLPDYPNDLNAMHEARLSITRNEDREKYEGILRDICGSYCNAIHAEASQKAEAFLKAKGLWK
jgi:hypothetical protein